MPAANLDSLLAAEALWHADLFDQKADDLRGRLNSGESIILPTVEVEALRGLEAWVRAEPIINPALNSERGREVLVRASSVPHQDGYGATRTFSHQRLLALYDILAFLDKLPRMELNK